MPWVMVIMFGGAAGKHRRDGARLGMPLCDAGQRFVKSAWDAPTRQGHETENELCAAKVLDEALRWRRIRL